MDRLIILESQLITVEAGSRSGVAFLSGLVTKRQSMKRSISEGDLYSSSWKKKKKRKTKHHEYEDLESRLAPLPIRSSIGDGDPIIRTDTAAEYPVGAFNLDLALMSPTPQVLNLNIRCKKPDPKVYLDEAWKQLEPALKSILHEEDLNRYSFAGINIAAEKAWRNKSGEALNNLILEVCEAYISTTLQSLAVHCDDDDDPSRLLLPLEKLWLEFPKKLRLVCDIVGPGGRKLRDLGLELFPAKLFAASQVRDKVRTFILHRITELRVGKPVNMSLLSNLMYMLISDPFRKLRFLEKPFLDSTAEFYAAEAKCFLEQSSDLPQYLKHVERSVGEAKKICRSLPIFSTFKNNLLEVVNRELLGVHACAILEKGFEKLMDERHWEDLRRMYALFSEADLLVHIDDALSSYIFQTGGKILKEGGSSLIEFKTRVDKICFTDFSEDSLLEETAQECFEGLGMSVSPVVSLPGWSIH